MQDSTLAREGNSSQEKPSGGIKGKILICRKRGECMVVATGWFEKLKKIFNKIDGQAVSRIEILCDTGFGNALFIRGEGAGLSWEKGRAMVNFGTDLWVWETDRLFDSCTFKVLINDAEYEVGPDHKLPMGGTVRYNPKFAG